MPVQNARSANLHIRLATARFTGVSLPDWHFESSEASAHFDLES
jgi:hypothetical protein